MNHEWKNILSESRKERWKTYSYLVTPLHYIDNYKKLFILWVYIVWCRLGIADMPPSSSGSGHLSFKEAAGIRLPLGVGYYERRLIMYYQLSLDLILPGSMPEWLMGTDCKFVGNMSTLVQIQLGPRIHRSIMRLHNIRNLSAGNIWLILYPICFFPIYSSFYELSGFIS